MSPYYLEDLYDRLGHPAWFWPAVFAVIFALMLAGSAVLPEAFA